ncbi:hypothetical protein ACHQM5_004664 [Ranunculus cassubicifolius]
MEIGLGDSQIGSHPLNEETEHTSKQRNKDSVLAAKLLETLKDLPQSSTACSIYKVPVNLRSTNESAYTPKVVSIGPIHHGVDRLKPMELQKHRYLKTLLDRDPNLVLENVVKSFRNLEENARNHYRNETTISFSSDQFVEMMLLDASFIVGVLDVDTRDKHEPLMFNSGPLANNSYWDLILLENQIPFFVLEKLYEITKFTDNQVSLWNKTFNYFHDRVQRDQVVALLLSPNHQVKHFVDFMLQSNLPNRTYRQTPHANRKYIHLPSATELRDSGVKFTKGQMSNFMDISFRNGVLEIPTLRVIEHSELFFRNLMAMEQCHESSTFYITDFMQVMDFLVNTANDVALLRGCGIIKHNLGSDEDVCQLFNNLFKGVLRTPRLSHYYEIYVDVSAYYNKGWNLLKARLKRDYFSNPWAIVSFIAAVVLLLCTLTQTVFSILSA